MKLFEWKKQAVAGLACLLLLLPATVCAEPTGYGNVQTAQGISIKLPFVNFGFEVITEGTSSYPITRTLTNSMPLDQDLTIFLLWGYTGDKFTVTLEDLGDTGDRLMGYMVTSTGEQRWGTMYSSSSQTSFSIDMPIFNTGVIVFLYSGFLTPSTGAEAYSYTIEVSYPQ